VDTHLYVQTLLQEQGEFLRERPEQIKYLLCPVLAQSKEEQKKFYRIFDAYFAEITRQAQRTLEIQPTPTEERTSFEDEIDRIIPPRQVVGWIVAGLILTGLSFFLYLANQTYDLPRADFQIHTPNGEVFSSLPDSIGLGQDTIHGNGLPGDTIRFHYTPLEDTLGLEDAELIWIYGDGTIDTIRETSTFYTPVIHHYRRQGAYLVQLLVKQTSRSPLSLKEPAIAVKHAVFDVGCPDQLGGQINWGPQEVLADQEVQFRFETSQEDLLEKYSLSWNMGDSTIYPGSTPRHTYMRGGDFKVQLTLTLNIPEEGICGQPLTFSRYITVNSNTPKIELSKDIFPLKPDEAGSVAYNFTPLADGLFAALITLLLLGLGLLIRVFTYKKPQHQDQYEAGERGPYILPLPSQDHLIAPDRGVYDLASVMRQRQIGNIYSLNMPVSIQKTIRESGLPILHYDISSRPSEYLVLIHQHHPESHLARFFARISAILRDEDVLIETFYYDQDPRSCWNADYPQGLSLTQMQKRFEKHRLILFSDGHHLINPSKSTLYHWVSGSFDTWKENRILLTPTPVVDWGYREKLIMAEMDVLPLDIPGQMQMIEMFEEEGQPDFEAHKKRMQKLFPAANQSIQEHDLYTVEGLREYLTPIHPALFRWVAATTVFPQARWEITLGIGHALSAETLEGDGAFLLTFENLLTLARIPWLQTQVIPSELRQALLSSLDAKTEAIARSKVLELIEQVKLDPDAVAAQDWAIQRTTQRFFLQPEDKEVAEEMYYLMEEDMLEDTEIRKRLQEPSPILDGKVGKEYLQGKFGMLRPREYFMGGIIGLGVFLLTYFLQSSLFQLAPPTPKDPMAFQNSWFVEQHVDTDEATRLHNAAVARADAEELVIASLLLDSALQVRSIYPLADSNQGKLFYRIGVSQFNLHDYELAINSFASVIPTKNALEVYKYTLGARGLAFYYLNQTRPEEQFGLDSARAALSALIALDEAFALREFPYLYEALQEKVDKGDLFTYHLNLAYGFYKQKTFDRALRHLDTALSIGTDDKATLNQLLKLQQTLEVEQDRLNIPEEQRDASVDTSKKAFAVPPKFYVDPLWVQELREIVKRLEAQKLNYQAENMADVGGIYHRIMDSMEVRFPQYRWANSATHRSSRDIAQWYHDNNQLTIVRDPLAFGKLIQPGAVLFFGASEKKVPEDVTIEELTDGTSSNRIFDMSVVVQVEKDKDGIVTGYKSMQARSPGKPASVTTGYRKYPQEDKKVLPNYGNWSQPWLAIAPPSLDEPAVRTSTSSYSVYRSQANRATLQDIFSSYNYIDESEFLAINDILQQDYEGGLQASPGQILKIPNPSAGAEDSGDLPEQQSVGTQPEVLYLNGKSYVYDIAGDPYLSPIGQTILKGASLGISPKGIFIPIGNQLEKSRQEDGALHKAVLAITETANSRDATKAVLTGCGYFAECVGTAYEIREQVIEVVRGKITPEYRLFVNEQTNKLWVGEFYGGQLQEMRVYMPTNPVFDNEPESYERIVGDISDCGKAKIAPASKGKKGG